MEGWKRWEESTSPGNYLWGAQRVSARKPLFSKVKHHDGAQPAAKSGTGKDERGSVVGRTTGHSSTCVVVHFVKRRALSVDLDERPRGSEVGTFAYKDRAQEFRETAQLRNISHNMNRILVAWWLFRLAAKRGRKVGSKVKWWTGLPRICSPEMIFWRAVYKS